MAGGVAAGHAFYTAAAAMNHSCAPNCVSLRLGGNMAVVALRDLAAGEEMTHSYLGASALLLLPAPTRAAHLHFVCYCARCVAEAPAPSVYPPGFAATPPGLLVTAFKIAAATAVADGPAGTLAAGHALLTPPAMQAWLREHPLAVADLLPAYLHVCRVVVFGTCLPFHQGGP